MRKDTILRPGLLALSFFLWDREPARPAGGPEPRTVVSLNGRWEFRRDQSSPRAWKTVELPASFEVHEGTSFDGVGWYRRQLDSLALRPGQRALLHVQAAATLAEVWCDGEKVGSHLGGWTPFRCDVTDAVRKRPRRPHEILIRVDEKVGHNTQGFLPVFEPHFGGIWQDVRLLAVPGTYIDDLNLMAVGNPDTGKVDFDFEVLGAALSRPVEVQVCYRLRGERAWSRSAPPVTRIRSSHTGVTTVHGSLEIPGWKSWSPESPNLYELDIRLARAGGNGRMLDRVKARTAFRKIEAAGDQLRLNGRPLQVRGVLNWGYYPPLLAPNPSEEKFGKDLALARSYGFNLIKFCLWVPPQRYLDLADEEGFLAWVEYPTWHPQLDEKHRRELAAEFREFFAYDRNHPSVVLRSLTCETGASAELPVIRDLYDTAHRMIPGSVIEDDSSWIGWNRVHDFYDDHPYGNNDTWVPTLGRLKDYIRQHGTKPLVLGEAIAADTWTDPAPLLQRVGGERPFWLPGFLDASRQWLERMRRINGPEGLDELGPDSRHYAMLMRKYQIETYRREVPAGGYVVSVIRDFPFAGMGLFDFVDRAKWPAKDWGWHGDTTLLLRTEADRRSFEAGEELHGLLTVSHFGARPIHKGRLSVWVEGPDGRRFDEVGVTDLGVTPGKLGGPFGFTLRLPRAPAPGRALIRARLQEGQRTWENAWPVWVVPKVDPTSRPAVRRHPSLAEDLAGRLFPGARPLARPVKEDVVVTRKLDPALLEFLEAGGRVLLLPGGEANSLPLQDQWFLRGGPYVPDHPVNRTVPRALWVGLQHFDLAGPVVPAVGYLEQIDPVLMLWDDHDLKEVRTHGVVFETRVGRGRLLVSALRHDGPTNAAGRWTLDVLLRHLADGPPPRHALDDTLRKHLAEKLREERIELVGRPWRFKPDPEGVGLRQGWHKPSQTTDASWKEIRIGQSWESQGYELLDGWAWYRIDVKVPRGWKDRPVYLNFEGVDDYYELYVNGRPAGKGGDLEKRQTAFDLRKSHDVTTLVRPGETCHLAVRVFDFGGAGGIFRPVTLGTAALSEGVEILK